MCGICGQLNFARNEPVEPEIVRRMTDSIAHRGPDDEGYFFSGSLGLGFRRLSIIDLAGGHQPMSDAEETVWVILNGEIYNFKELRAVLQNQGHRFRTNSDTEVIIHGYKEWGTEVLNHLNGMFGLAIWDVTRKRLVVARSGDLAYDFGDFTISHGAPDKTRTSFNGSYLRVWRKANGEWLVDAFFARPNEPEEEIKRKSGP